MKRIYISIILIAVLLVSSGIGILAFSSSNEDSKDKLPQKDTSLTTVYYKQPPSQILCCKYNSTLLVTGFYWQVHAITNETNLDPIRYASGNGLYNKYFNIIIDGQPVKTYPANTGSSTTFGDIETLNLIVVGNYSQAKNVQLNYNDSVLNVQVINDNTQFPPPPTTPPLQ